MRKLLLLGLMAIALPILCEAKNDGATGLTSSQLHLIENKGQVKDQFNNPRNDIQFTIRGKNVSLFVGNGQLHYQFYKVDKRGFTPGKTMADLGKKSTPTEYSLYRMDVELIGANPHAQIVKDDEQQYVERYYTVDGKRKRSLTAEKSDDKGIEAHAYSKVTYKNVYPNIDWVIYSKSIEAKYEFVVRPGGDPSDIKLQYKGATKLALNEGGSLTATTHLGSVTEAAPYSYQEDGREVTSAFNLNSDVVTFNVGQYSGTLVIDPTLAWGTYFGDIGDEEYNATNYDGAGNIYATGGTSSIGNMATVGAFQTTNQGLNDGFISKFTTAGSLVWSTFFGTAADDVMSAVEYNVATATLYVLGQTNINVDRDALLGIFTANGLFINNLAIGVAGTDEEGFGLNSDAAGNLYLCGSTTSTTGMGTTGSIQDISLGGFDGWIWKFNNVGTLDWGTYYGGPGNENLVSVGTDALGNVYAVGTTNSTADIATLNTYGGGIFDAYATKINSVGTVWVWGRYFGGAGDDQGLAADVDASGNLFMTGLTNSAGLAVSGFQSTLGGGTDAYITRLTTAGAITWSSYYGGSGTDQAFGLTLSSTSVYIGGYTESNNLVTTNGFQTAYGGGISDAFMARIALAGTFTWGSYYGGGSDEAVNTVATDNISAYCAGITSSATGISFNTLVQPTISAGYDAFISRVDECTLPAAPGAITGAVSVCAGSSQTYSIAAVTGATSYTWTLPSGWTGTSTTTSITTTVGTTGGTISVTANNSCGSSPAATLNITVNPIPTASITAGGPITFCQGGNVVLTANTGTGYTYQWFQGAPIPGATSSTYTATASGTYTVEVTANGCEAISNAITVTVTPGPATPTASANVPCVGQALNLTASSTTSGVTYDWTGPNNFSNTQNPIIASAQLSDAGVYTVTVTLNGCTASAQVTVTVAPGIPATPGPITGDVTVCQGSTETYTVPNDVNVGTYNWTLPTGWTGSSTTNSINATAGGANGDIEVTATNGCGTSAAAILNVAVNPLPTPVITQSGNVLSTTAVYTTYQWYDGSGAIAGATNQSYTPTVSGSYYVIVTDANGCTNQSNTLTITVSVNSISMAGDVALYPNPNDGNFTIKGQFGSNDGKVNIEVVDIAGRIVHKEQMTVKGNDLNKLINMNVSLAPGVYTLKLRSDVANAVIPFVKK